MEIKKLDDQSKRKTKVYDELNVFGKYQSRLCILLLLSTIPNAFTTFQFFAVVHTPEFHCIAVNGTYYSPPNNFGNSSLVDSRLMNTCTFENITDLTLKNGTKPNANMTNQHQNRIPQMICTDWKYEGKEVSAVTEFGMICSHGWQKPFSVSMFMFGKLVGGLIGGFISDKFGRKPTFLIFSAWQYLATLASSFSHNVPSFAAMMFLSGCGGLVNFVAAVLLGTEVVGPKKRSLVYVHTSVGFAIGCMLIALLTFLISDWRWFLRVTSFVGLLYIPYFWLLDESPRWLLAVGKNDEAKKILKKIAKCNKMQSSVSEDESFDMLVETDDSIGLWPTCKLIARTPTLLKRMAIVGLSWLTCSAAYYTISLDIGSLSGNRYLNILFFGLAELAATGIFFVGSRKWGNRNSYIVFMGVSTIVLAVGPLLKMANMPGLQVPVMIAGRLTIATCYCIIFVLTGELFPTQVRTLVMAYSTGLSRLGGMCAPFLIYAGHQTDSILVPLGMAALMSCTAILYIFLPNTKKTQLPQTVQEAEEIQSGLSCPCRPQKRKTKTPNMKADDVREL